MSTAVYRSEQKVFYGGDAEPPRVFYGWHIFGSATAVDIHPFETRAQQEAFVEKVAAALTPDNTTHPDDVAAYLAVVVSRDGDDGDRPWVETLLGDAIPGYEEREQLQEMTEGYLEEAVWGLGASAPTPPLQTEDPPSALEGLALDERIHALDADERGALVEALDDAVHELKGQEAAAINNRGIEAQISYVGAAQAREILDAFGSERTSPGEGMARLVQAPPLKAQPGPER